MPRNAMQISNIRKLMKLEERGDDELYSIMLQCKQETTQGEQFIRDVKVCPEQALILATGTQLDNLVHFSTNSNNFSILTIDPTFNLGAFDVTPVAYRHLILLNPKTGKPPVFLGPLLIHYRKTFSTYLYFAFTLIGLKPKLACLRAFGTDGEKALHDAFNYCYPNAVHFLCAIHSRRNINDELARRGYEGKTVKIFLQEIFGHRLDSVYCEGLIDSEDSATFDRNLASLKSVWKEREESCTGVTTSFYDWFINNKAAGMKASMLPSVRRAAHLDQSTSFTTNASETLNSMLKMKLNFTKSELSTFVQRMKSFVDDQEANVRSAFCGHSKYILHPHFKHLIISQDDFYALSQQEREAIVQTRMASAIKILNSSECPNLSMAGTSISQSLEELHSPVEVSATQPSSLATQPSSSAMRTSSSAMQPSSSAMRPSSSATQPSSSATQPSSSATQPLSPAMQPSSSATRPSFSAMQPSSSATQPSCLVTQSSSSATRPSFSATQPPSSAKQPSSSLSQPPSSTIQELSVSPSTLYGMHIPQDIIDGIWKKAARLVFTSGSIANVPGGNSSHCLVASTSAE